MKKKFLLTLLLFLPGIFLFAQCEILFNKEAGLFTLRNSLIERKILIDIKNHSFYTVSFKDLVNKVEYCRNRSREFGFNVNNKPVTGGLDGKMMDYQSYEILSAENGSQTLQVKLSGTPKTAAVGIEVTLYYEIYPDLAMVRKWMSIKNNTSAEVSITNPEWEITNLEIAPPGFVGAICTFADVYGQYGQTDFKPPYIGRTDDPAILIYDNIKKQGAIVGNEAPSILKRTSIYADGDWLSNILEPVPDGNLYMRKLCFERARVVPASSLLIGNLSMDANRSEQNFLSLLSATPMMLGDPRKMTEEKIAWFKQWSGWAKEMERKYNYTRYYQTSDIFSAPQKHGWDGCARINTEKGGGILCFYRNSSPESKRTFPIIWVEDNLTYSIFSPALKKVIGTFTGKELKNNGLTVEIKEQNSAEIFGIEKTIN